jgi:class 3 adenylate cyclase
LQWEYPPARRLFERLASFSRLILFDPRGVGISDPVPNESHTNWEHWIQDLRAVLDAASSERAAKLTTLDSAHWGILHAATHPERTAALVLWCPFARFLVADDYPIGFPAEVGEASRQLFSHLWGTDAMSSVAGPFTNADAARWFARYQRASMTPGAAAAMMRHGLEMDVRSVLGSISAPTLVLHARDFKYVPPAFGRYIADKIPGARFVELPTADSTPSGESMDAICDRMEDFLADIRLTHEPDRVLATILFTDIVGSTERASAMGDRKWKDLLSEHDRVARGQVERFRGRLVTTTGDGLLATFDGPGRAIRCAHAMSRALRPFDTQIRAGLHTGEIELRESDDIGGIAVHIAARVMAEAGPGEVVCSRTVKDLVAGSEFSFEDRGLCTLKGVPEQWQLYSVSAK